MKQIPLRARDGSVRAYALVDDADFEWLSRWRWCLDKGYVMRKVSSRGKNIRMHRLILGLEPGDPRQGEHEDRNPLNCCRSNLRIAERGEVVSTTGQSPDETQPSDSDDGLWLSAFALETAGLVQMQGENAGVQVAVSMTPREADQLAKLLTEAAQQVVDAADDGREQAVAEVPE